GFDTAKAKANAWPLACAPWTDRQEGGGGARDQKKTQVTRSAARQAQFRVEHACRATLLIVVSASHRYGRSNRTVRFSVRRLHQCQKACRELGLGCRTVAGRDIRSKQAHPRIVRRRLLNRRTPAVEIRSRYYRHQALCR